MQPNPNQTRRRPTSAYEIDYGELQRHMSRTMDEFQREVPALQAAWAADQQRTTSALARQRRLRLCLRVARWTGAAAVGLATSVASVAETLRLLGVI